jgi:hypothetical protein
MVREIDIWDIVCVVAKNDYTPASEAHDVMCDRYTKFDDMSLDYAKRLSRRALQCLEPYLVDGVVVGNVDIEAILVQQLNLPLEQADLAPESDGEPIEEDGEHNSVEDDGASENGNIGQNGDEVPLDVPDFVQGP